MSRLHLLPASVIAFFCLAIPFAASAETHLVRPGDTLWGIANRYGVSQEAIRQANRLQTDSVMIGQALAIPGRGGAKPAARTGSGATRGYHVVSPGDTFSGIAARNGVTMAALQAANPGVNPDPLLVGTRLAIPGRGTVAAKPPPMRSYSPALDYPADPNAKPKKPAATPRTSGASHHTVRPGDTLTGIAAKYGISSNALLAANQIANPDVLPVGLRLSLPGAKPTPKPQAAPASYRPGPVAPPPPAPTPKPKPKVAAKLPEPSTPKAIQKPTAPKPKSSDTFAESHRAVLAYRLEKGDNLQTVANLFGTTPDKLRQLNKLPPGASLKAGDELVVPAMASLSN
jgi:LysM repeat protein